MNDGVLSDGALTAADTLAERYRVIEPIGSGGMARVYLAHDEALGRRVAVKVLRSDVADEATADRAAVETRLLASLNHPGLVTLFDAHLAHEPRFLVMEHVVGSTLAARIADGPLGMRELTALGSQLADALHVVHDAGIVHRDVKPSNILLARSTAPGVPLRAKLADFGIAHLLDGERLTSPSLLVGTAAYIAPELLHGADPAPPSDIYALGLVLLEAASGTRAFAGAEGNRGQLLARLSRDPEMPAALDHRWRELMCAMTAREPADRPTAHEVMAQLTVGGGATGGAVVSEGSITASSEQHRRAALAGVATAAWPVTQPSAPHRPEPATPPDHATGAPVAASAASTADPLLTAPTIVASTLTAAAASVPERITADRRRRRGRRRLALATGATAAAGIAAVVAASLLLWQPGPTPTTDPAETPAVQTPAITPGTETVVSDTSPDVAQSPQQDTAVEQDPPTGTTVAPAVDQTGAGGADQSSDSGAGGGNGPGSDNGSSPGSNSGNGNGPGSNSGNGPGSNSGNGNGPGSNSGNGNSNSNSNGKPAPGDR